MRLKCDMIWRIMEIEEGPTSVDNTLRGAVVQIFRICIMWYTLPHFLQDPGVQKVDNAAIHWLHWFALRGLQDKSIVALTFLV